MAKYIRRILFLPLAALLVTAAAPAQQQPDTTQPVTLQQLNLLLRRSVGRDTTEGDLAARIDRYGIAFDATPESISRLRANGAHAHLINAVKRAHARMIAASGATVTVTGPTKEDEFLAEVRRNVRDYLEELPDFICHQEITRYIDNGTGAWQRIDTLVYELTYNKKRESYRPINAIGRPATRPLEQSGGAYSTGDWATALAVLFDTDTKAAFTPAGKDRLGQRPTMLYDFTVAAETSKLSISSEGLRSIIAGYSGTLWIDAETRQVLRLEQAADDLPAAFPVTQAENAIDYDMVKLRGIDVEFLLPTHAEFIIADRRRRQYSRNQIYFKFYRKFETDVKVLDEPETSPAVKPPAGGGKEER